MPRRDDEDDDDRPRRPRRAVGSGPRRRHIPRIPAWGWLLIAGGLLMLICAGFGIGGMIVVRNLALSRATTAARKTRPAAGLSALVKGRTLDEVVALLGNPDRRSTDPAAKGAVVLTYAAALYNPANGRTTDAAVVFADGVATGKVN